MSVTKTDYLIILLTDHKALWFTYRGAFAHPLAIIVKKSINYNHGTGLFLIMEED
ncbi:hypothetical protein DPMN_102488 [Dreissena polymorpha]|uniref:Uncharacterized protein n=1 Tax=Dreissena polymorpha TaxID=45954 RepID=A0A9D4LL71_DREPO|nr:hypothetical protein DPMN_102488 [Dreissena polymorpha]